MEHIGVLIKAIGTAEAAKVRADEPCIENAIASLRVVLNREIEQAIEDAEKDAV